MHTTAVIIAFISGNASMLAFIRGYKLAPFVSLAAAGICGFLITQ